MDIATFLIQLLNAVQYGLLLFLVASGLTLIFGIMGIVNLAHGSFYMIGAYLAWSLSGSLGNFWAAIALGIVLSVLLGMLLEWLLIRHLYRRDHLYQVLLTYGLILIFEELRSIIWGDDVHGVPVPDVLSASVPLTETLEYPVYRLWMSGVCVVLAVLMYWLTRYWFLAHRRETQDDPVVFALKDGRSLLAGLATALIVAAASFKGADWTGR